MNFLVKLNKGEVYTLSCSEVVSDGLNFPDGVMVYNKDTKTYITQASKSKNWKATFTAPSENIWIRLHATNEIATVHSVTYSNIMLEKGETATEYTPYKDDYKLNSVGDVADTYNPLTGEYVQRVGILKLNGNEMWNKSYILEDTSHLYISDISDIVKTPATRKEYPNIICSHYPTTNYYSILYDKTEGVSISETGRCSFRVPYSDRASFNAFLQEQYTNGTPVTIYYELEEPIKTIINKVYVSANIPNTTMALEDSNNLGIIKTTLQTKG